MTMTPLRSMPVLLMLLVCVFVTGCHKKTVLVMPQQPPPATAPTPAPVTRETPPPKPQPSPTPEAGQNPKETARKNHTRPKPHNRTAKKSAPRVARNRPLVIDNGDVPTTVAPAPSPELAKQMEATDQLLKNTEKAINGISRGLSQNEQAMLAQIRDFINQSREATKNNDFGRAHNLALKAHLLSDELVKK